jgi:uncharacterized protein Yka (UPF0111/DUF47 family)
MKTQILAAIGETGLMNAASINAALAANDRLKYYFSLLQMAILQATQPDLHPADLRHEGLACGIEDDTLDGLIAGARMAGGVCHSDAAAAVLARIKADLRVMAAPLLQTKLEGLAPRLLHLLQAMPEATDGALDPAAVMAMMQAEPGGPDSPHRLVMEMHKALNRLQASMAEETLSGASVYNLLPRDRPLVAAFMAGVNRTLGLKFNHPGLATTATSDGARLVLQNDIGTTDAHVIVVHVEGLTLSVTYTDLHPERVDFFQAMLQQQNMIWAAERNAVLAGGSAFTLVTGQITCKDSADCCRQLDFLGSRLVFLIDWNRARKQLRGFLRGPERLALLSWAAANDVGHRGFLELGGAALVNRAIEATSGSAMHFGDRLCDVLGIDETSAFFRWLLRVATEGLRSGQSLALLQGRIRVALAGHFSNEEKQLLAVVGDHASLIFELARLVRDGLQSSATSGQRVHRAGRFEQDADQLVLTVREAVTRRPDHKIFLTLLEQADDAADALEEAAFLLTLSPLPGPPREALQALADLIADATQEWVKAVFCAAQADNEDFLKAVDLILALEHQADSAERTLSVSAIHHAEDFRQLHLFALIGAKLEQAADALKHAGLTLRDHVLEEVVNG